MELEVKTLSGGASGKVAVGFEIVKGSKGNQAVHDVVVAYTAAQRSGTPGRPKSSRNPFSKYRR